PGLDVLADHAPAGFRSVATAARMLDLLEILGRAVPAGAGHDASGGEDSRSFDHAGIDRVAHGERHSDVVTYIAQGGHARIQSRLCYCCSHERQPVLGGQRHRVFVERHRDVLVQIDQSRQHEAIFQVDEPRIGAIALSWLIALLDRGDLAVVDDNCLLTQRLLTWIGEQCTRVDDDDGGKNLNHLAPPIARQARSTSSRTISASRSVPGPAASRSANIRYSCTVRTRPPRTGRILSVPSSSSVRILSCGSHAKPCPRETAPIEVLMLVTVQRCSTSSSSDFLSRCALESRTTRCRCLRRSRIVISRPSLWSA